MYYAKQLQAIGEAYCILPNENFSIELERKTGAGYIDIICKLGKAKAAIELKCFKKSSNRPGDVDRYDCFKDLSRLESLDEYDLKFFICLTDLPYYAETTHKGKASMFSTKNGCSYEAGTTLTPEWSGQWKDKSRDHSILIRKELVCNWVHENGWYYWKVER